MSYSGGNTDFNGAIMQLFEMRYGSAKISAILNEVANYGEAVCKDRIRKKTGFAASKVHADVMGPYQLGLFSDAPYSKFLNDGTYKMTGDGYFDYSVNAMAAKLLESLKKL